MSLFLKTINVLQRLPHRSRSRSSPLRPFLSLFLAIGLFLRSCSYSFAFREVIARKHRDAAWFVAGAELELALGARKWTGAFLVSALWRKSAWSSNLLLADLSLARLDPDQDLAVAVSKLQLWT